MSGWAGLLMRSRAAPAWASIPRHQGYRPCPGLTPLFLIEGLGSLGNSVYRATSDRRDSWSASAAAAAVVVVVGGRGGPT